MPLTKRTAQSRGLQAKSRVKEEVMLVQIKNLVAPARRVASHVT